MAQVRHGLLFDAGIGFENLKMDTTSADYLNGIRWNDEYDYNFHLGYRFRFEEVEKGLQDVRLPEDVRGAFVVVCFAGAC